MHEGEAQEDMKYKNKNFNTNVNEIFELHGGHETPKIYICISTVMLAVKIIKLQTRKVVFK